MLPAGSLLTSWSRGAEGDRAEPFVLALDSSGSTCSAAVAAGAEVLAQERLTTRFGQAECLLPLVDAVVRRARLTPSTINLVGVTVGPGSFTGIRVALSAARGIALAMQAPLIGVTSFEAVATQFIPLAGEDDCHLLVALESRREDLYVQLFGRMGIPLFEPKAVMPGMLGALLGQGIGGMVVAGDAATRAVNALAGRYQASAIEASAADAAGVLRAVLRRWRAGERAGSAVPLYLRPPDVTLPPSRQGVRA